MTTAEARQLDSFIWIRLNSLRHFSFVGATIWPSLKLWTVIRRSSSQTIVQWRDAELANTRRIKTVGQCYSFKCGVLSTILWIPSTNSPLTQNIVSYCPIQGHDFIIMPKLLSIWEGIFQSYEHIVIQSLLVIHSILLLASRVQPSSIGSIGHLQYIWRE